VPEPTQLFSSKKLDIFERDRLWRTLNRDGVIHIECNKIFKNKVSASKRDKKITIKDSNHLMKDSIIDKRITLSNIKKNNRNSHSISYKSI